MSNALKITIDEMTDKVFEGVETQAAGEVYQSLNRSFPLVEIRDQKHHQSALEVISRLMEYLNEKNSRSKQLTSQIASYLGALTLVVESYEKKNFPTIGKTSPVEVLKYLMECNGLKQSDLAFILGGQSVVSDVLNEKRELNLKQIKALSTFFHISPTLLLG